MSKDAPIDVHAFYRYGYKGRDMIAIRAPFAMAADAAQLIGRDVRVDENIHRVLAVARQISGPIHQGEPIGIEIAAEAAGDPSAGESPRQ